VSAQPKAAPSARSAAITLGGQSLLLEQSGAAQAAVTPAVPPDPCQSLRLSRSGEQITPTGTTGAMQFAVIAEAACNWRAESKASWISLVAGAGASGNGTVAYTVDLNPFLANRSGEIVVGDKTFTVDQLGDVATAAGGDGGGDGGGGGGGGSGGGSG
jgi:hypothetical protein